MIRRPPRSTRTDTLFPYPTLFRSAVVRIDLLPRLQRARAPGLVEGAPVTLAQAEETGIATLGGQVHPCIGERAVAFDAGSVPQHLRHHPLRPLVREVRCAAEQLERIPVPVLPHPFPAHPDLRR